MDSLVKQIVTMDRTLRDKVSQEETKLNDFKNSVAEESKKVREEHCTEAHKRIDLIRQQNQERIEENSRQTEQRYQRARDDLQSAYEKNKSVWVGEIVSRCLKG